jgi:hypothetical protein
VTEDDARVGPPRRGPTAHLAHALATVLVAGAVGVLAAAIGGCGDAGGDDGLPPAPPSAGPPSADDPEQAPPSTRPNEVQPEAASDLRRVRWSRAEVTRDGRRLRVHTTLTGGPPCTVLGRVDTRESASTVTITLWAGRRRGEDCGGRQPQVGFPIVVTVDLAAPLAGREVRDGAAG